MSPTGAPMCRRHVGDTTHHVGKKKKKRHGDIRHYLLRENLLRKYEAEMTSLKKFVYTYLPLDNLSSLPSGTTQLQQLKRPIIAKIWKIKLPVSNV
jgi:hypothetical protein